MHRRGPAVAAARLLAAMAAALAALVLAAPVQVSASAMSTMSAPPAPTTVPQPIDEQPPLPERPPVTVSDFLPEDANLSDCIGLVERPGCGSEARGGLGQTAVFVALVAGLGLIFWRVIAGVRRNRKAIDAARGVDDRPEQPVDPSA